jgi:hypothetical protein
MRLTRHCFGQPEMRFPRAEKEICCAASTLAAMSSRIESAHEFTGN